MTDTTGDAPALRKRRESSAPRIESWPSEPGLLLAFASRCVSGSLAWDSKWKSRSEWDERDALAEARLLSSEGRNHADLHALGSLLELWSPTNVYGPVLMRAAWNRHWGWKIETRCYGCAPAIEEGTRAFLEKRKSYAERP